MKLPFDKLANAVAKVGTVVTKVAVAAQHAYDVIEAVFANVDGAIASVIAAVNAYVWHCRDCCSPRWFKLQLSGCLVSVCSRDCVVSMPGYLLAPLTGRNPFVAMLNSVSALVDKVAYVDRVINEVRAFYEFMKASSSEIAATERALAASLVWSNDAQTLIQGGRAKPTSILCLCCGHRSSCHVPLCEC